VGWVGERPQAGHEQAARLKLNDRSRLEIIERVWRGRLFMVNLLDRQLWEGREWRGGWGLEGGLGLVGRVGVECDQRRRENRFSVLDDCSFAGPLEPAKASGQVLGDGAVGNGLGEGRVKGLGRPGTAEIEHSGDQIGVGRETAWLSVHGPPPQRSSVPRGAGYGVLAGQRGGSLNCMLHQGETWFLTTI